MAADRVIASSHISARPRMSEGRASPPASSLPDDEDILGEILLRLPPLPSSLPRASLVSKLWHRVVCNPTFRRRFRAHHHNTPPPLLGFFFDRFFYGLESRRHVFTPTLAAPDRIPAARFSCPSNGTFLSCRHGLALLQTSNKAVVWEPVTDRRCSVDFPPGFGNSNASICLGAVLRDPPNSSTFKFKLVMVFYGYLHPMLYASMYESESGRWGEIISVAAFANFCKPSVLVGNKLYWLVQREGGCRFLEFDIDQQAMTVIQMSEDMAVPDGSHVQALRTKDGELGFAVVSKHRLQLCGKTGICDDVVSGVLEKTVELDQLLPLRRRPPTGMERQLRIVGYDEDTNAILLWTNVGVFMIQLDSIEFTKVSEDACIGGYYPFASFYDDAGLL